MTQPSRLLGGIAVGCVAVVGIAFLGGCVFVAVTTRGFGPPRTFDDAMAFIYVGMICAFAAAPITLITAIRVGVPIFLLWRRQGYTSLVAYVVAGVLMSAIAALVLSIWRRISGDFLWLDADYLLAMAIVAVAGPVAALTVQAVARQR